MARSACSVTMPREALLVGRSAGTLAVTGEAEGNASRAHNPHAAAREKLTPCKHGKSLRQI